MVEGKILDWFSYRGSFFVISIAPVSDFKFYAESHFYQWLRRNTIDRLTIKPVDTLDVDAEVTWQERQDAETALRNYLDDLPSMSFLGRYISVSFHIQRTSHFFMDPRVVANQKCCPAYSRTSGIADASSRSKP